MISREQQQCVEAVTESLPQLQKLASGTYDALINPNGLTALGEEILRHATIIAENLKALEDLHRAGR